MDNEKANKKELGQIFEDLLNEDDDRKAIIVGNDKV